MGSNYLRYFVDSEDFLCQNDGLKELHLVTVRADGSYIQSRATQHSNHVIKTELGIENFDFHSLRHTHATELSEAGVNLKEIQRRLGHKSLEITTRKYIHATDEMQRQSLEIMNRMYQVR
ncbi:MAG: tyrosine-type recombinase/integrase [Clostridiales bacterium]|nr:tyrosine-type recombinase/integrase [Clostridiales bacterium]